jgi:hypothetical protein
MVEVEVELAPELLLALALEAHDKNITLNELCNKILKKEIEKEENKCQN